MGPPENRRASNGRRKNTKNKHTEASLKGEASVIPVNTLVIFRLVLSALSLSASIILKSEGFKSILLSFFSVLVAGYDIFIDASESVRAGEWTDDSVLISFAALASFFIGFEKEGAAAIIICQAMRFLIVLISDKLCESSLQIIEHEKKNLTEEVISSEEATYLNVYDTVASSIKNVFTATMIIAVVYAVILNLFLHFNIRVSIHRAITVILISTPYSMLVSIPLTGKLGICAASLYGIIFKKAADIEHAKEVKTLIVDRGCFPESRNFSLSTYKTQVLDEKTFFTLAAHVVYHSEQEFAQLIKNYFDVNYIPELISDFSEENGGAEALINGKKAYLGTNSYLERHGVFISHREIIDGIYYYLYYSDKIAGYFVITEDKKADISDVVHDFRYCGINRCILICNDSGNSASEFAESNEFDDVYLNVKPEFMEDVIHQICDSDNSDKIFLSSMNTAHTDADIEVFSGHDIGEADALILPECISSLTKVISLGLRMHDVAFENALFAIIVKAILVFFILIGYCNLWMAMLFDMAAAVITVINSKRVAGSSFIRSFVK